MKGREIEEDNLFVYLWGKWKEEKGNKKNEILVLKNNRRKLHNFIQNRKQNGKAKSFSSFWYSIYHFPSK